MGKIDGYITPVRNGENLDYRMNLHYNGVDFCFLYRNEEAAQFARRFAQNVKDDLEGVTYTDTRGYTQISDGVSTVIASVKGIDNIGNSLVELCQGCLAIGADFNVHVDGKDFKIVDDNSIMEKMMLDSFGQLERELHSLRQNMIDDTKSMSM